MKETIKLVLLRHGQSQWNLENRFTGWKDVDLSEKGIQECINAGKILKEKGYSFDLVYTSYLKRATKTTELCLKEMGLDVPIKKSWRLNERHYGALIGLNKDEMRKKHGEEQVHIWRRSFDTRPPLFEKNDKRNPSYDEIYSELSDDQRPMGESLKDTIERVLPYWESEIVPQLRQKKKILISAHGNSLRALVKHLDNVSDAEIPSLEIPTGKPLVYELDENLNAINHYYLE